MSLRMLSQYSWSSGASVNNSLPSEDHQVGCGSHAETLLIVGMALPHLPQEAEDLGISIQANLGCTASIKKRIPC